MTPPDTNKQIVRRVVDDVIVGGRLELIDELFTASAGEAARAWITPFRASFPDVEMEIVELVAEDDRVAGRFRCSATHSGDWRGRTATNRRFANVNEVYFFTLRDGRVDRMWGLEDTLDRMRQLRIDPD